MSITWKAPADIEGLLTKVKEANHPHLATAKFALAFTDTQPFIKNRFNWGTVRKFSSFNKLWQGEKYDFSIVLCADIWKDIFNASQQEAWLDLLLSCCEVELEPEVVVEGNKKKQVKDEWGRVKFTDQPKYDDDGNLKYRVVPIDLIVLIQNIKRYGLWCDVMLDLKDVIQ